MTITKTDVVSTKWDLHTNIFAISHARVTFLCGDCGALNRRRKTTLGVVKVECRSCKTLNSFQAPNADISDDQSAEDPSYGLLSLALY